MQRLSGCAVWLTVRCGKLKRLSPARCVGLVFRALFLLTLTIFPHLICYGQGDAVNVNFRLVITVMRSDRREPLEGASMSASYLYDRSMAPLPIDMTLQSDADGKVYIVPESIGGFLKHKPKVGQRFIVTISHPDFQTTKRTIPVTSASGDLFATVALQPKSGSKFIEVNVFSLGDHMPLYEAQIKLRGLSSGELFYGSTNSAGRALVKVTHLDIFEVSVSHAGYKPDSRGMTPDPFNDENPPAINFDLTPNPGGERVLNVAVKGRDKSGNVVPVRYATVKLPDGQEKTTDYEGRAQFRHALPPGEDEIVTAEATYYKSGSATFMVGMKALSEDNVVVMLNREAAGSSDDTNDQSKSDDSGRNSSGWAGTWVNGGSRITISGGRSGITATEEWSGGGREGTTTWTNCRVDGLTATCDYEADYRGDPGKSGKHYGTVKVSISGNKLTGASKITRIEFVNSDGTPFNVNGSFSAFHIGAEFSINHTRQ